MRTSQKPKNPATAEELANRSEELPITKEMIKAGALLIFSYNDHIASAEQVAEEVYAAMYALDPQPARWKREALECRERYGATPD